MSVTTLALVALIFALAGLVKGIAGLGLPVVAMGLLGLFMLPAEAAALLILPSMATNLWQLWDGPRLGGIVRRLWPMMLCVFAATLAASGLIAGDNAALAAGGLGLVLLVYAILGLLNWRMRVSPRAEPWAGPLVGAITGTVAGATGVFTVPSVPYIAALGFERDELVQALGFFFTISTIALAAGLALHGAFTLEAAAPSIPAMVGALGGMTLGARLRRRIEAATFLRWFFVLIAILGAQLLLSALW